MSKFTVCIKGSLLGFAVALDKIETDDPREVTFQLLRLGNLNSDPKAGPYKTEGHVHAVIPGVPSTYPDPSADPEHDHGAALGSIAATSLICATAVSGEPYEVWEQRATEFYAEHKEEWSGVTWDTETHVVQLAFNDEKQRQVEEAREAVNGLDDAFEQLLAEARPDTGSTGTDRED